MLQLNGQFQDDWCSWYNAVPLKKNSQTPLQLRAVMQQVVPTFRGPMSAIVDSPPWLRALGLIFAGLDQIRVGHLLLKVPGQQ